MARTYCLLVGINRYFHSKHNLRGCINDLNSFREYLELSFDEKVIHIKTLENEQATKENIIEGFKIFQEAKDGDTCIFYFSGHGSTWEAPDFLYHLVPDKLLKSLVCHDSRKPGKIDLMDKELAYLIWEATYQKEIQFIAITDCCHSGGVTKDQEALNSDDFSPRELEKGTSIFSAQSFYVTKDKSEKAILSSKFKIKRGRHIHLAACRGDQKAVEGEIQNERRGVFTYHLIDTLKKHSSKITYKELMDKVKIKVQNKITDQSPQLFVVKDSENRHNFLSNTFDTGNIICQVYYKENQGWLVNCGLLNSLLNEDSSSESYIQLVENNQILNNQILKLQQIHATYSILSEAQDLDSKQIYSAHLILKDSKKLKFGLFNISDFLSKDLLDQYKSSENSFSFSFSPTLEHTELLLRHQNKIGYYLTNPTEDVSLFKKNKGFSIGKIQDLFTALEKVAKWKRLLELCNTKGTLVNNEIEINFFRITESDSYTDHAKKELVSKTDLIRLEHQFSKRKYHNPGFQLSITNTGNRPLWISLLYLSDDYFITNRLFTKEPLNPKATAWAIEKNKTGDLFRTINVKLSDQLYEEGMTSTLEYLKVLVSTEEFDSDYFNQASVASNKAFKELTGKEDDIKLAEWDTHLISLEIHRP